MPKNEGKAPMLTGEQLRILNEGWEIEYEGVEMTDAEWEEKRWLLIAQAQLDADHEYYTNDNIELDVYHRMEMFWYEPETVEILEDLFAGEGEASPLTKRLLEILGQLGYHKTLPKKETIEKIRIEVAEEIKEELKNITSEVHAYAKHSPFNVPIKAISVEQWDAFWKDRVR